MFCVHCNAQRAVRKLGSPLKLKVKLPSVVTVQRMEPFDCLWPIISWGSSGQQRCHGQELLGDLANPEYWEPMGTIWHALTRRTQSERLCSTPLGVFTATSEWPRARVLTDPPWWNFWCVPRRNTCTMVPALICHKENVRLRWLCFLEFRMRTDTSCVAPPICTQTAVLLKQFEEVESRLGFICDHRSILNSPLWLKWHFNCSVKSRQELMHQSVLFLLWLLKKRRLCRMTHKTFPMHYFLPMMTSSCSERKLSL